jgi:Cytochrome P450
MYPEVQRKAQAYIDAEMSVEAGSRLPTWADLEDIPYISAILKEVGRWHSVIPLGLWLSCTLIMRNMIADTSRAGLPHVSREDDVYEGYHIPANTAILPNTW